MLTFSRLQSISKNKQCGEVNSVKNTTINIWLNDGAY